MGPLARRPLTGAAVADAQAAGSHVGFLVHLVNSTAAPCVVTGYPRVTVLDAAGHRLQTAAPTTRGYLGGLKSGGRPPVVTLRPGGEATSLVEGNDVADPSTCGTATTARVGIPHEPGSTAVPIRTPTFFACPGVDVHPLIAGATGSSS